jgi:hypothetical protein
VRASLSVKPSLAFGKSISTQNKKHTARFYIVGICISAILKPEMDYENKCVRNPSCDFADNMPCICGIFYSGFVPEFLIDYGNNNICVCLWEDSLTNKF